MSNKSGNKPLPDLRLVTKHIEALRRDEPQWKPYGKGNPYYYCEDCEASNVQGHHESCRYYEIKRLTENLELLVDLFNSR